MKEQAIELWVEKRFDALDKELMQGAITGAEYSKRASDIAARADNMAREVQS
jgi:hypothetical protein